MSNFYTANPEALLAYASAQEDQITGADPDDHLWLFVGDFPVKEAGPSRQWRKFWKQSEEEHPGHWGEGLLAAVQDYEVDNKPLVAALFEYTHELNVWDGNHRLAAAVMCGRKTMPVVLGIPKSMTQELLPAGIRALPQVQEALPTAGQALARDLLQSISHLRGNSHGGELLVAVARTMATQGCSAKVMRGFYKMPNGSRVVDTLQIDEAQVGFEGIGDWATLQHRNLKAHGYVGRSLVRPPKLSVSDHPMVQAIPAAMRPIELSCYNQAMPILEVAVEQLQLQANTPEAYAATKKSFRL